MLQIYGISRARENFRIGNFKLSDKTIFSSVILESQPQDFEITADVLKIVGVKSRNVFLKDFMGLCRTLWDVKGRFGTFPKFLVVTLQRVQVRSTKYCLI